MADKDKVPEEIVFTTTKGDKTVTHRIVRQEGESAKSWEAKQRRAEELHPELKEAKLEAEFKKASDSAAKLVDETHLPKVTASKPQAEAPSALETEFKKASDSAAKLVDETRLPAIPSPKKPALAALPTAPPSGALPPGPPPPLDSLPAAPPAVPAGPAPEAPPAGVAPVNAGSLPGGVPDGGSPAIENPMPDVRTLPQPGGTSTGGMSTPAMIANALFPGLGSGVTLAESILKEGAAAKGAPAPFPPSAAAPGPAVPGTPAGLPQAGNGVRASASVSGRVGGAEPTFKDAQIPKEMLDAQQAERDALASRKKAELEQHGQILKMQQENLSKTQQLMDERNTLVTTHQTEMQRQNSALAQLQAQVLDAGKVKVDPNHYWSTKSGGQKAMSVLAAACFGFAGKGMDYLQRLDSLVEQDIRAQQANIENQKSTLGAAVGIQNNIMANARAQGLDALAAKDAAYAMHWQNLQQQLEVLREGSPAQMQAKFEEMSAALATKSADANQKLKASMEKAASDKALTAAQVAHLRAQSYATRVGADASMLAASQKGRGKEKVTAEIANKASLFQQALDLTADLKKLRTENFKGLKDKVTGKLGEIPYAGGLGYASPERARYETLVKTLQPIYGQVSGSGVLAEHEAATLSKFVLPSWSNIQSDEKMDEVVKLLQKGYQGYFNSLAPSYELSGLTPPEAYAKKFKQLERVGEEK